MSEIGFSCATCPCYRPTGDKLGVCHRFPPHVMLGPSQTIVGQVQPYNLFPGVGADSYCWEHPMAKQLGGMPLVMPVDSRLAREPEGEA